jgi:hypothetical protein
VPSLLSPADEAVLMDVLRNNPGAAHVQMLTTPLLVQAEFEPESRGFLERFRREKTSILPPDDRQAMSFAEQIASSLKRALEHRPAVEAVQEAPEPSSEPDVTVESQAADIEIESEEPELPSIAPQDPIPFNLRRNDMFATESGDAAVETDDAPDWSGDVGSGSVSLTAETLDDWSNAGAAEHDSLGGMALTARPFERLASRRSSREAWQDIDPFDAGFLALLARLHAITSGNSPRMHADVPSAIAGTNQSGLSSGLDNSR